jgi:hypothetical protein
MYCHIIRIPPAYRERFNREKNMKNSLKSLQTIAGEWHGGQTSALYAYASTGTVLNSLIREIKECFPFAKPKELSELQRLYVNIAPQLTREAILNASEFWHRIARNADGSPVRCRKSGRMQTWKTRPEDFSQPVKYGLKESFRLTPANIQDWTVAP